VRQRRAVNAGEYDKQINHWFTRAQVAEMYVHNPLWADVERRVYGNLYDDVS
jgi:hypothetical protein